MTDRSELHLWFWSIISERTGKRVKTTWRMTEPDARERYGAGAVNVESSLEVRRPIGHTSDFLRER